MSKIVDLFSLGTGTWKDIQAANAEFDQRILAPNESKGYRYPVVFSLGNLLLTKESAWIGHKIPMKPWGFLSDDRQQQYFRSANTFYEQVFPSDKYNSGQLILTNLVYSGEEWRTALTELHEHISLPIYNTYVNGALNAMDQQTFYEKECFLFTRLGSRGEATGLRGTIRKNLSLFASKAGADDYQPDEEELAFWAEAGDSITAQYGSTWVNPTPMSRRRVEALVRHQDTPGLPTPDVASYDPNSWERGEWRTVLSSYVEREPLGKIGKYRAECVRIDSPTGVSYAAYLPVAHIPGRVRGNANWLHKASRFNFPVDAVVYFEILGSDAAEKVVGKAIEKAEVQQGEDAEAGIRPDEMTMIQSETARSVKTNIVMGRRSLARWRCVLSVNAPDKQTLRDRVDEVITRYKEDKIDLYVPHRDQREMYYESLPANGILVDDWFHLTNVEYLAAAMPWLTTSVGDGEDSPANYQGWTINADGSVDMPFFYDLQNVAEVAGTAPTEAVIATPGMGKTLSRGMVPAHQNAMMGHTVFIWDPKGDFIPLKAHAKRLKLVPERVMLLDMNSPRLSVSLDAYEVAEVDPDEGVDDRLSSARDVLTTLSRKYVNDAQHGLEYQSLILRLVQATMDQAARERDAATTPDEVNAARPTMARSMRILNEWREGNFAEYPELEDSSRNSTKQQASLLYIELNTTQNSKFGKFLFNDPTKSDVIRVSPGDMIIFAAKDMPYTEPGETPTEKTIVGDIISGLMVDYIRALIYKLPSDSPKNVYLDEYHAIKKSPRGEALAIWLKRMGRSKNTTVTQMSQSADDIDRSSLSTVWCGRPPNSEEAVASCALLDIEATPENIQTLLALKPGEFLMRDVHKRVARVYVNVWDSGLFKLFNTQAATIARQKRAAEREKRKQEEMVSA